MRYNIGLIIANIFLFSGLVSNGQSVAKSYRIKITDNRNLQLNSYEYLFKDDSLKIFGTADNGKSKISYFSNKLNKKQRKAIRNFISTFPVDSLQSEYFDAFTSFGYITADHFPRVIEVEIRRGLNQYKSKATNAWVAQYVELFNFLNAYIPDEGVKLKFLQTDFKKSY